MRAGLVLVVAVVAQRDLGAGAALGWDRSRPRCSRARPGRRCRCCRRRSSRSGPARSGSSLERVPTVSATSVVSMAPPLKVGDQPEDGEVALVGARRRRATVKRSAVFSPVAPGGDRRRRSPAPSVTVTQGLERGERRRERRRRWRRPCCAGARSSRPSRPGRGSPLPGVVQGGRRSASSRPRRPAAR